MSDTTPRDQLAQIIHEHIDCDVWGSKMDCGMDYPSPDYTQFGRTEHLADAIVNAGWRPPARVVTTREELEALPEESIILDAGVPAYLLDGLWSYPADQSDYEAGEIMLPVTVLYEPEEGE